MDNNLMIPNKPRKVMRNAFIITAIMIAGAVAVGNSKIDGMNGGYAIIVFLGLFALSALITALVYIPRAREFDALIQQIKPLARWTYNQKEWEAFIREDLREMMVFNKATLKYVATIALVVLAILLLIYQDILFVWIIAALILLLTIVAFITPRLRSAALKNGIHEAIIGEKAAYVGGTFQTWTKLGAHLIAVDIYTEGEIPILHIIYEFPTLQAYQQEVFRIPVPVGKMQQAEKVAEALRAQIK